MVVSPALAALLKAPGSTLLRQRLPYPVTGTIGAAGLLGPGQLSFLVGSDRLSIAAGAVRISSYGYSSAPKPMDPKLVLLELVGFVVLLAPVGVFLAAATRFGGEQRDRRLAALRLAGADRRTTARVAAGEALVGAALGLLTGGVLFLLGRRLLALVAVAKFSFFAQDIAPQPAAVALIATAVPLLALTVTLAGMRRAVVDPLGVVRRTGSTPRRLGRRLLLPLLGLGLIGIALLLPGGLRLPGPGDGYLSAVLGAPADAAPVRGVQGAVLAATGVLVLLLGLGTLLPWLVEAVARRLRGGALSWQLAVRRLQLAPGPAATAVSGVVVTVAGAIALQTLFLAVSTDFTTAQAPGQTDRRAAGQYVVTVPGAAVPAAAFAERLAGSPGVELAVGVTGFYADARDGSGTGLVRVAECATLRLLATLPSCADGDVFVLPGGVGAAGPFHSGANVLVEHGLTPDPPTPWQLPASAPTVGATPSATERFRTDPYGGPDPAVLLATPGAVPAGGLRGQVVTVFVTMAKGTADPADLLMTDAARISPLADALPGTASGPDADYRAVEQLLGAAAAATLLLVAVSLVVGQFERLRAQRRVLGVLLAFGTRRRVLGLSVLWEAMIPMALGLLLAAAGGLAMGAVLQYPAGLSVSFDWEVLLALCGIGAGSVLLVTLLGLPLLLRLMRPDALRSE
jgi:hypothetical protein